MRKLTFLCRNCRVGLALFSFQKLSLNESRR
uniref:Uncharacterized protein n=1 Tax=Anguilla anguilla TaxID=7936 RepID=A0A0E9W274_ANGAN